MLGLLEGKAMGRRRKRRKRKRKRKKRRKRKRKRRVHFLAWHSIVH